MQYGSILDSVAYGQISKQYEKPDARLCIGDSENLSSIPVLIFTDFNHVNNKPVINNVKPSFEEVAQNFSNDKVETSDFPNDFYIGNPIE
jgi:hypothetical protein